MEAVVLKATQFTIPELHVHSADVELLDNKILTLVQQNKELLVQSPVVLVPVTVMDGKDLAKIIELCYQQSLIPIGVKTEAKQLIEYAEVSGIAVFKPSRFQTSIFTQTDNTAKIIHKTVRSGQQVIAKNRDLIVLGAVHHGAELIASGNISIYGKLTGKALAGADGNKSARIFVQNVNPELVAIAGIYSISQTYPENSERWLQIYLKDNVLEYSII